MSADEKPNAPASKWSVAPSSRETRACESCGLPYGTPWGTSEGTAWLCRECATLHGLGCP